MGGRLSPGKGNQIGILADVEAPKAPPQTVAERSVSSLAAGQAIVFLDDASASAGSVYLWTRSSSSTCSQADTPR